MWFISKNFEYIIGSEWLNIIIGKVIQISANHTRMHDAQK